MSKLSDHFDIQHSVEAGFSCTCGHAFYRLPDFLRHYITCPVAATDLQDPTTSRRLETNPVVSPTAKLPSLLGNVKPPSSPEAIPREEAQSSNGSSDFSDAMQPYYNFYKHPPVVPIKGPTEDRPFGCPKCPKGFKSKSLLEQHMHLHYPPRYKCRWCSKVYRWPPVYYHHMRTCKKIPGTEAEQEMPVKLSSPPVPENENVALDLSQSAKPCSIKTEPMPVQPAPTEFKCPCGASLADVQSYFKHAAKCLHFIQPLRPRPSIPVEQKQPPQLLIAKSRSKRFVCNICAKDFTSKLSLKQHVDGKHRAEGKYVCKLCGKRYRWGASFYYHRRTCSLANGVSLPSTGVVPRLPHISQPSA